MRALIFNALLTFPLNKNQEIVKRFFIFSLHLSQVKRGKRVDVRRPKTFKKAGFIPEHETALIIHGFNGTQSSKHIRYLRDGKSHMKLDEISKILTFFIIQSVSL